jgi:hypothetical protein
MASGAQFVPRLIADFGGRITSVQVKQPSLRTPFRADRPRHTRRGGLVDGHDAPGHSVVAKGRQTMTAAHAGFGGSAVQHPGTIGTRDLGT